MLKVFKDHRYMPERFHIAKDVSLMSYCDMTSAHGRIVDRLDSERAKSLCPECVAVAYDRGLLNVSESLASKEGQ